MEVTARPREKVLMWRILLGAILTAAWLFRRGFTNINLCPWGCGVIENTSHIICDCLFSREIKGSFARFGFLLKSYESIQEFCSNLQSNMNRSCLSTHLQIAAIYQMWKARNAKVHGKSYLSPFYIAVSILNSIQDIKFSTDRNWSATNPLGLFAAWHPPPERWIKVNYDGSFLDGVYSAIGIVVRGHDGKLIKAYGRRIRASSAADAEICAATSLALIIDDDILEAQGIILEGDSEEAYKYIKANIYRKRPSTNYDYDFSFLSNFNNIVINCISREFNRAADFCAKAARMEDFIFLCDEPLPNELNAIMESDYG